jgi:hypothetical protein
MENSRAILASLLEMASAAASESALFVDVGISLINR